MTLNYVTQRRGWLAQAPLCVPYIQRMFHSPFKAPSLRNVAVIDVAKVDFVATKKLLRNAKEQGSMKILLRALWAIDLIYIETCRLHCTYEHLLCIHFYKTIIVWTCI